MSQEWGLSKGLNPVLYLADESPLTTELRAFYDAMNAINQPSITEREKISLNLFFKSLSELVLMCKPTTGNTISEPNAKIEFYRESEWRYTPKHPQVRRAVPLNNAMGYVVGKENADLAREHCSLQFSIEDIRHIIVPTESEIPRVVEFIEGELKLGSAHSRRILTSRVMSYVRLNEDY